MLECIMHHTLPYSDSCLYWCLAYIREGISNLRIYVAVTSSYPRDRGVTGWYQSLGSHILSTSRWQINGKEVCNWNTRVLVIQSNYKCRVIYPFFLIHFLNPETFNPLPSSFFLLPTSINSNMERRGTRNGAGTSQDGSNRDNDDMIRILQGMMQSRQQQTELLRQGLLVVPREQRPGNVSDFRRLQPTIFSGTEKPLDA